MGLFIVGWSIYAKHNWGVPWRSDNEIIILHICDAPGKTWEHNRRPQGPSCICMTVDRPFDLSKTDGISTCMVWKSVYLSVTFIMAHTFVMFCLWHLVPLSRFANKLDFWRRLWPHTSAKPARTFSQDVADGKWQVAFGALLKGRGPGTWVLKHASSKHVFVFWGVHWTQSLIVP